MAHQKRHLGSDPPHAAVSPTAFAPRDASLRALAPQSQWLSASPDAPQIPKPRLMIRLDMQGVTYVISCTDINAACVDFAGSTSSGGIVDLALDAGGARPVKGKWYLFG